MFSFGITRNDEIVLCQDSISVINITKMKGYSILRQIILDQAVDSLGEELRKKGLVMNNENGLVHGELLKVNKGLTVNYIFNTLLALFGLITWIAGAVIAQAGWLKVLAIFFFPYAWYLVIEKFMQYYNIIT